MIFLDLFITFFKLGLFSFGGGYVMVPLIQSEVVAAKGWITAAQFADVVAVSQMTPGPIAVNAATFIGASTAGVLGAACATFGVSLPSFILVSIAARMMEKFKDNRYISAALSGIRPVTVGMIASAAFVFATMSFLQFDLQAEAVKLVTFKFSEMFSSFGFSVRSALIFVFVLVGSLKFKLNPIFAVFLSGVLGAVFL